MAKTAKIWGATLLGMSAVCFLAGGFSLNSALGDKSYWENKGAKSEADLNTLENGLNQLKSNEKAYLDGQKAYAEGQLTYEQGKKDLASGQKDYDTGYATLLEKQAEYDAGVDQLAAAEAELAAGKQTLDENYQAYVDGKAQIAQYEQGQRDYEQGLAEYNAGKDWVDGGMAQLIAATSAKAGVNLETLDAARQYVEANEAKLKQVQQIVEANGSGILSIKSDYENWESNYAAISAFQSKTLSGKPLSNTTKDEYKQVVSSEANADVLKTLIDQILADMPSIASRARNALWSGINFENDVITELNREGLNGNQAMNAVLNYLFGVPSNDAVSFKNAMDKIAVVSNATIKLYSDGMSIVAAFRAGEAELNAGQAQLIAAEPVLAAAKQTLDENYQAYVDGKAKIAEYEQGEAEYNAGLAEYNAGKAKLADGAEQLAAGREELEAGRQTIEDGKMQLASAEIELNDGKAQLAQFENGRDQAIDGINTVVATETYGNLTSIADRLGTDFEFVDNEGNLNISQGMVAVSTARGFLADNTEAVTSDLTGRTVVSIVILVAGVLALGGGIVVLKHH